MAQSQPILSENLRWRRPLDTWLERAEELGPGGAIPGVLDKRGWSVPRARYTRISAIDEAQFNRLLNDHPTLHLLATDPNMTTIAVGSGSSQTGSDWIIGFFQDSSNVQSSQIESALMADLNRYRNQLGLPAIERMEGLDYSNAKVMECFAARKKLREQVQQTTVGALWLSVTLNQSKDFSIPSCRLRFRWSQASPHSP